MDGFFFDGFGCLAISPPAKDIKLRLQRLGVMIDANSVKIIAKAASIGDPGQQVQL